MQASGNCYKVRLLMALLGIPFKVVDIDVLAGETRSQFFLQKNPAGLLPVLELPNEQVISESNAILYYLAENTDYFPHEKFLRAQVMQWMFFEQYSHEPNIAVARFWRMFVPDGVQKQKSRFPEWMKRGYAALDVMEKHLNMYNYFSGTQYSIADMSLYAYTHVAHEGGFDLQNYPAIRDWLIRVEKQPRHVPFQWRPEDLFM